MAPLPIHRMKRVHDNIGTCDTFACTDGMRKCIILSLQGGAMTAQIKPQLQTSLRPLFESTSCRSKQLHHIWFCCCTPGHIIGTG